MSDSTLFSKTAADLILKRAGEIESTEAAAPLSAGELRAIAGEAGFGAKAVNRAIAEALRDHTSPSRGHMVHQSGIVFKNLSTARVIPMELTSEQLIRTVRLFQPYRDGPPNVNLEERQITWKDARGLRFNMVSGAGTTEIRVFVSGVVLRRGRWTAWVTAAADQLEGLIFLVAVKDPSPGLQIPDSSVNGLGNG